MAILWRTHLDIYVTSLHLDIDWIICTKINAYVTLCVNMPYKLYDCKVLYLVNSIKAAIEELDTTCLSVLGDLFE